MTKTIKTLVHVDDCPNNNPELPYDTIDCKCPYIDLPVEHLQKIGAIDCDDDEEGDIEFEKRHMRWAD